MREGTFCCQFYEHRSTDGRPLLVGFHGDQVICLSPNRVSPDAGPDDYTLLVMSLTGVDQLELADSQPETEGV